MAFGWDSGLQGTEVHGICNIGQLGAWPLDGTADYKVRRCMVSSNIGQLGAWPLDGTADYKLRRGRGI